MIGHHQVECGVDEVRFGFIADKEKLEVVLGVVDEGTDGETLSPVVLAVLAGTNSSSLSHSAKEIGAEKVEPDVIGIMGTDSASPLQFAY